MIAQELEVSLHMAFVEARQKRHEFITVEHLLLALLDNPSAAEVLRACAANIDELRKVLGDFIKPSTRRVPGTERSTRSPRSGFQRVIQRAILHVQSSGKKEVTGANVLVAIFGEKDSHAVYFLHQQGITRWTSSTSSRTASPRRRSPRRQKARPSRSRKQAAKPAAARSRTTPEPQRSRRGTARSTR
jgi:ATP-dependent Clp protease ATP-binding subunit ClpA